MSAGGHTPVATLAALLQSCTSLPHLKLFHSRLLRLGLCLHPSLFPTLLSLYSTLSSSPFSPLPIFLSSADTPPLPLFNLSLKFCPKSFTAVLLYRFMVGKGMHPDHFTYPPLLSSCAAASGIEQGREVHSRVVRTGHLGFLHVGNALVDMYGKFGELGCARRLFVEMPERDVVSCNAVLGAFTRCSGDMGLARGVFDGMEEINLISWNAMVVGYVNCGDVGSAREMFDAMPEKNLVSWNTMVVGYMKKGLMDSARSVFDEMPERNLVSWAAMISGYAQNGKPDEAIGLFKQMEEQSGLKPDAAVMVGVISSVAQLGSCELAIWVATYLERMRIDKNDRILTALVDMHAKCGNVQEACLLFEEIPSKDVLSYTALINGLASHGHGVEALGIFNRMQAEGILPDGIAFMGILNACRHAGLVEEGLTFWDKMVNHHRINPDPEHYACVVDMLGRVGRLDDAYNLVKGIPSGPNTSALGAVLAACKNLGEIRTAETVAQHLFQLEPENTGNYMLLWSMYASRGNWGKAALLRQRMKEKGIKKLPGCSYT